MIIIRDNPGGDNLKYLVFRYIVSNTTYNLQSN